MDVYVQVFVNANVLLGKFGSKEISVDNFTPIGSRVMVSSKKYRPFDTDRQPRGDCGDRMPEP